MARLAYLYLLRVPIITALLLVAFPILAVTSAAQLLENLFCLNWTQTFWVALTAVLTAWSIILTAILVLVNASSRMGLPAFFRAEEVRPKVALTGLFLAVPALVAPFFKSGDFGYGFGKIVGHVGAVLAGIVAAYVVSYLALLVAVWLAPPGTQAVTLNAFPVGGLPRRWLTQADGQAPWVARAVGWAGRKLRTYPRALWAGYLNPATGEPWSGHWLAFSFGVVSFALYEFVDFRKRLHLGEPIDLPAAMFVLWLFLCANWLLSLAAFFLDRFRIPLVLALGLACWFASLNAQSDHYFRFQEGGAGSHPVILSGDVIRARAGETPLVAVATAGGGIQAAVWTAQVLTGLQKDSLGGNPGSEKWPADFASSLAMVSSVSGGATGAMFFLNQYRDGAHPGFAAGESDLPAIITQAAKPSLDDVAWALVDHDIPRLYFPYSLAPDERFIDRGEMLETDWRNAGEVYSYLADWRKGVANCAECPGGRPWRPAAIFNSTIVETGRPLLLGTTDLQKGSAETGPLSFYDWFPNCDLPVTTAVRLAATFPYVSPAARPFTSKPENHAVDGGYFDNYGVATLVEWLWEGLEEWSGLADKKPPILVIQIRSFPATADSPPTHQSAAFQIYAPISALLNVRDTGQVIRDQAGLRVLQELWQRTGGVPSFQVATLRFEGTEAPLSWAINPHQQAEVTRQWNRVLCGADQLPTNASGCHPEEDLQLIRCVMRGSPTEDCKVLINTKQPW
ncbi:MAG TPA: hypothetical protein VME43_22560 [Bryobacteraceae bacterium]|nr:hypothetical protein [Bryobacteraceae bacterium]